MKEEVAHIVDPSQCGSIVRRHFDGIVIGIYVFIGLFLLEAIGATLSPLGSLQFDRFPTVLGQPTCYKRAYA